MAMSIARQVEERRNLRAIMTPAGVFEFVPVLYMIHFAFMSLILGGCIYILTRDHLQVSFVYVNLRWWVKSVLLVPVVVFAKTQLAFDSHDAGHRQWCASVFLNDVVLRILTPVLGHVGSLWIASHNAHHANPNHLELDPNVIVPIYTFHPTQGTGKWRKYQAYFYALTVPIIIPMMRVQGITTLWDARKKGDPWLLEMSGMVFYFASSIIFLVWFLGPLGAFLFALLQEYGLGVYLGLVFASNHKGMKIVLPGEELGVLREQLETSRDVGSRWFSWLIDFFMGGLNHQSIHHVFARIPRWKFAKATKILEVFCQEKGLFYERTSLAQAYIDIFKSLDSTGHGGFPLFDLRRLALAV